MELDVDAARAAVQTVADAMGLESAEQAAEGIIAIVNENMAGALRLVSVQRGHDPRDFALVAYGGAGPLHANAVAELMGSFPVIVPPAPGLLCAIGDLVADFRDEFAQTYIRLLGRRERRRGRRHPRRPRRARDGLARGRGDRRATPSGSSTPPTCATTGRATRSRSRSTRPRCAANGLGDLEERFNALHEQLYGFRMPGTACEIVNLRAVGYGAVPKPELPVGEVGAADASAAVVDEHEVVFDGERRADEDLRPREAPARAPCSTGPAIVTEFDSTTVVLPGYRARSTSNFNILITPND